MQADNDHKELARLLDELSSRDVAPRWHRESTWFRLQPLLHRPARRVIPLWSYPLAASVVAVCLLFLHPFQSEAPYSQTSTQLRPLDHVTAPASEAPARQTVQTRSSQASQAAGTEQPSRALVATRRQAAIRKPVPEPVATQGTAAYPITKSVEPPSPEEEVVRKPPQPIVYTLSEIMNEVPEKETPARRYSGLFGNQNNRYAPGERANTGLTKQALQQGPPEIPSLITY